MARYKRKDTCGVCGKDVIYDDQTHVLSCGCYSAPCKFVNLAAFAKILD